MQVENDAVVALTLKIPGSNFDHYFDHPFSIDEDYDYFPTNYHSWMLQMNSDDACGAAETGEWEDVNIEKPADHANLIESESG